MEEDRYPESGLSRRSVLKRMGAGAAIAWSAPILSSFSTPAFAQSYGACQDTLICAQAGPLIFCGDPNCFCLRALEGEFRCGADFFCASSHLCDSDAQCADLGPGAFCQAPETGCCGQVCVPACGTPFTAEEGKPTNSGR